MEEFQMRFFVILWMIVLPASGFAAVEITPDGKTPMRIEEVYHRNGTAYLAVDDVLATVGLRGSWQPVEHVYEIITLQGKAIISPGSHFLRSGGQIMPLDQPPKFIDGRLRVTESFVQKTLAALTGRSIGFHNLNPGDTRDPQPGSDLDRLFAFLLRRGSGQAPGLEAVSRIAIDPGHGGQDPGAIGVEGAKEKNVTLEVARRLEKQIKMQLGIPVTLARNADYALDAEQRLQHLSRSHADLLLVLHAQASLSSAVHGVVLFVRPSEQAAGERASGKDDSMRLAMTLQSSLRSMGVPVAGIVQAPLLPLGRGDLPTVLVEMGYLSHAGDQARLSLAKGQQAMASALFEGLNSFIEQKQEEVL
jgi:N-acetylmuramoyl-L-alanine amidase